MRILLLLALISACGKPITEKKEIPKQMDEIQVGVTERKLFGIRMFMNFDYLPLNGKVKDQGRFWSGDSWRLKKGSINYRWNAEKGAGPTPLPHPRDLHSLTQEQLRGLAPSEKYDLWMGRYDYPLKHEVEQNLPPSPLPWEGLCHGWAGASLNFKEPTPKELSNPDGFLIPFGSADIKALLTYYYASLLVPTEDHVGRRCDHRKLQSEDLCDEDVTPVDFHTILTNKIALRGESFIADVDRYHEVWNHPVVSFESHIVKMTTQGFERTVRLKTLIRYIDVAEDNSWIPTNQTFGQIFSQMQFEYELRLDLSGNMLGGKWLSSHRPDFIWTIGKVSKFEGYLSGLKQLLAE